MDYFQTAVQLARQEGAATLAKVAVKSIAMKSMRNKGNVCGCSEYSFPHRKGSGRCPGQSSERSFADIEAEMLQEFDRNEARSINGGAL
jgi:hypothetical protein